MRALLFAAVVASLGVTAAQADTFRCAAEARDGFAEMAADGTVSGPAVALCRDTADRRAGSAAVAQLILVEPDTGGGLPQADAFFLSRDMIAERQIGAQLRLGAVVFHDPVQVMVPDASPVQQPRDLAGQIVCLMIGSPGQHALEDRLADLRPAPIRLGFRETDELRDAYNVGRCAAVIGEASYLAQLREETGINHLHSRLLDEAVGDDPILAADFITEK